MNNKCPCNGCVPPRRCETCHATCKEYIDWKAVQTADYDKQFRERLVTIQLTEMSIARRKKRKTPAPLRHGRITQIK